MIEIDVRPVWPEALTEFVARDEIAGPLHQQRQHLEGLFLETDPNAAFRNSPEWQSSSKTPNRISSGGVEEGSAMDSLQKALRKYWWILPQSNLA